MRIVFPRTTSDVGVTAVTKTVHAAALLGRVDFVRLVVGWGAVGLTTLLGSSILEHQTTPVLIATLAVMIAVIVLCSFGVVKQAEALAVRLGDPYGSLVLTLSIVLIEVILIAAVMLGPGKHATIGRDSVMAVSMIILNLVVGLAALVGGLKHGRLRVNRTGVSGYLAMLVVLIAVAFALPAAIGRGGSYLPAQAVFVAGLTVLVYAVFLMRQMGPQVSEFTEKSVVAAAATAPRRQPIGIVLREYRAEVLLRLLLLVAMVLPIVLLSHDMAALLDEGVQRAGAPVALAGVLIAMIVFLPESLTAVRAALGAEMQRVSNLCHGALVSTVGLTIPSVLVIGLLTGQTVILAESPANLLMLLVTMMLTVVTFTSPRVTAVHGVAHLATFALYGLVLFSS